MSHILFDDEIDGCHVRIECNTTYGYASVIARVWNGPPVGNEVGLEDGYRYLIFFTPVAVKVFGPDQCSRAETWALEIVERMGWELLARPGVTDYIG